MAQIFKDSGTFKHESDSAFKWEGISASGPDYQQAGGRSEVYFFRMGQLGGSGEVYGG